MFLEEIGGSVAMRNTSSVYALAAARRFAPGSRHVAATTS
jgi:hypothetical protein